tara:strand:- start:1037 stop:1348 length:312 start_codon:yes stop_codon:yes gene_type:complete
MNNIIVLLILIVVVIYIINNLKKENNVKNVKNVNNVNKINYNPVLTENIKGGLCFMNKQSNPNYYKNDLNYKNNDMKYFIDNNNNNKLKPLSNKMKSNKILRN